MSTFMMSVVILISYWIVFGVGIYIGKHSSFLVCIILGVGIGIFSNQLAQRMHK